MLSLKQSLQDIKFHNTNAFKGAIGSLLFLSTVPAFANGFYLPEQNVTNLGTAYAGTAALAEDSSTNFYNPAGLTRMRCEQVVVGGIGVSGNTKLNVTKATGVLGQDLSPDAGTTRPYTNTAIPLFHYSKRFSDQFVFGFSGVSTFGSRNNYQENSLVRYTATTSQLFVVDMSPGFGYSFCNGWSVGGAVDFVYTYARLAQAVDVFGTGNLATDGWTESKGTDISTGYHAGLLYEFDDCMRLGLTYHSFLRAKIEGETETQLFPGAVVTTQDTWANVTFPDYLVLSGFSQLNDCWALMFDAAWFRWKRYHDLNLLFENNSAVMTLNDWKNSWRVALGGSYQVIPSLKLRFGASYDRTPTKDSTRKIYLPDQDQTAVAIGGQYRVTPCLAIDFGYAHVFYKKATLNHGPSVAVGGLTQTFQRVQGKSRAYLDAFGLSFTIDFT